MSKQTKIFLAFILFFIIGFVSINTSLANGLSDADADGIPDQDELNIYKTDPNKPDTDGDGYSDRIELLSGYSPHNPEVVTLEQNDYDRDGLSDRMELNFGTDIKNSDTDGDAIHDGVEIKAGTNPKSTTTEKLPKRMEINIAKQELSYFLDGVRMGKFPVSSGIYNSTPRGHFQIHNKSPKAWSPYGLWMPNWMAITPDGKIGLHELPIWPNGYREGENHLGKPVSHGCVRLGVDAAKFMYGWTEIGTPLFIY